MAYFGPGWASALDRADDIATNRAERQRREAADVREGEATGKAAGSVAAPVVATSIHAATGGATAPFDPAIQLAVRETGGQIGRVAAGGEPGFADPARDVRDASTAASRTREGMNRHAYFEKMDEITKDEAKWRAYQEMPYSHRRQMETGDLEPWDSWWSTWETRQAGGLDGP